ncbi:dedicator of cytokinesis [Dictyocaulus viviparus]|uniref:Dedicator of cytokinesis n=1 Tax=Dictyocaulus viviparus TaxID=29172 RepID=A0A0D8XCA1_DICVI|nr:dedicator of cytokinesis [Dictyocaulus viviparus]
MLLAVSLLKRGSKNKMTAADVRKHVMTGSLMMLHPTSLDMTFSDGSSTQTLNLVDVVDPVDVEEALAQRRTSALYDISSTNTSPRKTVIKYIASDRVSEFPADDVEVRIVPREWTTIDPPIPNETKDLKIEPHVRDIISSFTDQFSLIQKRYQQFGSADAYVRMVAERPIIVRSTTRQIYETDAGRAERIARSVSVAGEQDSLSKRQSCASTASSGTMGSTEGESRESRLHQSQPDPTIPGVIQRSSFSHLDQLSDARRQSGRHTNLISLLPLQHDTAVVERRATPPYPEERVGQKLVVKVINLNMDPYFEPVFGSIAIYDAKVRRKVSENFYFDVNPEEIRRLISKKSHYFGVTQRCNQAAFSISCPLSDLFMVIKLEKVLQACEITDGSEPYTGSAARDDRTREKLSAAAADYCDRLGAFRMPLGFMIVDLQKVLTGANSLERSEMNISTMTTGSVGTAIGELTAPLASISGETDSIVSADRLSNSSTSTFRRMGSGTSANAVLNRVRTPLQRRKLLGGSNGSDDSNNADASSVGKSLEMTLTNLQPILLNFNSFYRQEADRLSDEDLYKLLGDARRPSGKLSRLKTFNANLSIQLSGGTADELQMRLSPEMLRVAPFTVGSDAELTKDIQEFPAKGFYMAHTSYRNLLYIYPKFANLTNRPGTARNISIKVELMNGREQPLDVIFSKSAGSDMVSMERTTVVYHNKTPHISDEIKLRIPVDLDDGHHLLFTFYHISCKPNNRDEEIEYPIGYSWLPLFRDGRLSTGDFHLPICLDRLPTSYGYLSPDVALPNVRWLDGHKPAFSLSITAVSTVHPQDEHLEKFFIAVNSLSSTDRKKPPMSESAVIAAVHGVTKARPEPMVAFLYNILDKLIALIANRPYSEALSSICFETMGQLVKICTMLLDSCLDFHGRSALLTSYVHYFKIAMKESRANSQLCKDLFTEKNKTGSPESQKLYNIIEDVEKSNWHNRVPDEAVLSTCNKAVHEELAELWVRSGGCAREMAFLNAWFFLELMIKSMAEYLSMTGRLYLTRRSRFSERFVRELDSLSAAAIAEVVTRLPKDPRQATAIANSWAFFVRDAFSLMDRSYVMGLVRDFNRDISSKISCIGEPAATTLMLLKLDFVRIVSSHEHYVILNLPFGPPHSVPTSSSSSSLGVYSIGGVSALQLQPLSPESVSITSRSTTSSLDSWGSLGSGELTREFRKCHYLVGLALADLAAVLDSSNSSTLHSRAISVVHNLLLTHEADSRLTDAGIRARIAALYLPLVTIVLDISDIIHDPFENSSAMRFAGENTLNSSASPGVNPKVALAIAGIGSASSPPCTPNLLACFCWVLKNVESSALRHWVRELPPTRLSQLLNVLHLCVSCFEYKPSQLSELMDAACELDETLTECVVTRRDGIKWRVGPPSVCESDSRRASSLLYEDEVLLEAALCTEIVLCVLDTLETIIRVISMPGSDHLQFALPMVLRGIMHMFACNQSVQALECIFVSQRTLVKKFSDLIFEQEVEQCGELCLQLLRHCASRLPAVRSQSAASLYLLMRESFESGSSLARVKMQITMSLSTLVSNATKEGVWLNEDCLRRSLKVKDLVFNIHMILSDTVKLKEFANDFEMTIDLMYRVAKGYQTNPDLRLAWLLNMASRHADRELYCEAGQCMLHAAALAAEYIAMATTDGFMPRGAVDFEGISDNILEECAVSDDVLSPDVEGICESRHFTAAGLVNLVEKCAAFFEKAHIPDVEGICESRHFTAAGLVNLVEKCAAFFEKAHMYELLPIVFQIVEPIVTEWRDYRRLSTIHARISDALARVEPTISVVEDTADAWMSPLRSTDKRCFGTYFRVGFYGSRFGDLDGEEYIYKEAPFTKLSEISHRLENFYTDRFGKDIVEIIKDSNNEIDRFVYATPFTRDGKAHGDLKDQYKRRTLLTTQQSFPYVKTRIRVVEREQRVLQPIQVAIEDIEKKTRELSSAISQSPPDAKILQMVLQGCIGTTVNQGPIQVANVFLTDVTLNEFGKPVDRFQNKLRLCFRDFSKKCADALMLNKQLILPDQLAYQTELQKNYIDFTRRMAAIMDGTNGCIGRKESIPDGGHAVAFVTELGPVSSV